MLDDACTINRFAADTSSHIQTTLQFVQPKLGCPTKLKALLLDVIKSGIATGKRPWLAIGRVEDIRKV
jgi:hypothetical protein